MLNPQDIVFDYIRTLEMQTAIRVRHLPTGLSCRRDSVGKDGAALVRAELLVELEALLEASGQGSGSDRRDAPAGTPGRWSGPRERLDAARSTETSPEDLHLLAGCEHEFVKVAVAGNPNTAVETLLELAPLRAKPLEALKRTEPLASNPRSNAEVLRRVAVLLVNSIGDGTNDRWAFAAGIALCSRPETPLDALRKLLRHRKGTTPFRKVIAREAGRRDVLELLATDPSIKVQRALARRRVADEERS